MLRSLEAAQAEWKPRIGTTEELRTALEAVAGRDGTLKLEPLHRENPGRGARTQAHVA